MAKAQTMEIDTAEDGEDSNGRRTRVSNYGRRTMFTVRAHNDVNVLPDVPAMMAAWSKAQGVPYRVRENETGTTFTFETEDSLAKALAVNDPTTKAINAIVKSETVRNVIADAADRGMTDEQIADALREYVARLNNSK